MSESVKDRIRVLDGDIIQLKVDAIVNAANNTLMGGGGVDGAIHQAAGPELAEYCATLEGCETGQAKISPGFQLPAKYIIHTVGPIWNGGMLEEEKLLANCYQSALIIANQTEDIHSIAFPAISCGAYGYPIDQAATIAIRVISEFLLTEATLEQVLLVCFGSSTFSVFQQRLEEL